MGLQDLLVKPQDAIGDERPRELLGPATAALPHSLPQGFIPQQEMQGAS
jgi:hypothetical protein